MENALSKLNKKQVENTEPLATLIRELSRICLVEGCFPQRIQCDNGSEFISKEMDLCGAARAGVFECVTLDFSRPGKPTDNPYVESFNGKFRAAVARMNAFRLIGSYLWTTSEEKSKTFGGNITISDRTVRLTI